LKDERDNVSPGNDSQEVGYKLSGKGTKTFFGCDNPPRVNYAASAYKKWYLWKEDEAKRVKSLHLSPIAFFKRRLL